MRNAIKFATVVAFFMLTAEMVSAQYGEHIVGSQVISDTVVGGNPGTQGHEYQAAGMQHPGHGGLNYRSYGQPDLFHNQYTQGPANGVNAQMYVAPQPVPPSVGHTFYTYQPFMPHEMLYKHTDRFHNYYDNGRGMNRTKVHYYYPPVRQAVSNLYWNKIRLPR